jgi:hypothetical protein
MKNLFGDEKSFWGKRILSGDERIFSGIRKIVIGPNLNNK